MKDAKGPGPFITALPAELLQAVATPGGGRIALVLGAGCSVEAPTSLPLSRDCSLEIYRRLIADGVLQDGDCTDPTDLSLLAEAVFNKRDSQRDVVERFRDQYDLKFARPNAGYQIAAAMLCEGVITSIVTLNFDLAMSHALFELGAGLIVGIVEGPDDLPKQKNINVYYLHGNVNAADTETWILRKAALEHEWQGHWQPIIATKVLVAPIVVFAGLGTPVAVLIESTKLLREALPQTTKLFQVDPGEITRSKFFEALTIDSSAYIQRGWCELMEEMSERLSTEHIVQLQRAIGQKTAQDGLQAEDVTSLLDRLRSFGIVKFGKVRASWLLHGKPYRPVDADGLRLIADLLLALGMIMRVSGSTAVIFEDGYVEFRRERRIIGGFLMVSGCGHRGKAAVEAEVESRRAGYRNLPDPPSGVLVGGTSDTWMTQLTSPRDIVTGDMAAEDIIMGPTTLPMHHIAELRSSLDLIHQLLPGFVTQGVQ